MLYRSAAERLLNSAKHDTTKLWLLLCVTACQVNSVLPCVWVQDYLLAPMPFLVGVPAAGSFAGLRSTPLDEITVVNLDTGTCTPGPGLPPAEPSSLPWAEELAGALQVVHLFFLD